MNKHKLPIMSNSSELDVLKAQNRKMRKNKSNSANGCGQIVRFLDLLNYFLFSRFELKIQDCR